jgi:hypothetical protein
VGGSLGQESWRVACHSGWAYAERPVALLRYDERWEITAVESMWRSPQGLYFVVMIEDKRRYRLLYNEAEDHWLVEPI